MAASRELCLVGYSPDASKKHKFPQCLKASVKTTGFFQQTYRSSMQGRQNRPIHAFPGLFEKAP